MNKSEQVLKLVKSFLEELQNLLTDDGVVTFRVSQDRPLVSVETPCGETACRQTGPTTTTIYIVDNTNVGKIL